MNWLEPIRNYCERTSDLLWSEPLNAITNLSFLIAAWLLWKRYKASATHDRPLAIMITLVAIVGIGSSLFHTFANRLTMLADVIPIALFTFFYLWHALRSLVGVSIYCTIGLLLVFVGLAVEMSHLPGEYRFNGSADYFPCLGALLAIGISLFIRGHAAAKYLLAAALCFMASLTFRSVDFAICESLPVGTHFLWHSINGVMLYLLVSAFFIKHQPTK
jgi:hypothetical protein